MTDTHIIDSRRRFSLSRLGAVLVTLAVTASSAYAQRAEIDPQISDDHQIEVYISEEALQVLYSRDASLLEDRGATMQGGLFVTETRDIVGIATVMTQITDPDRYQRWSFEVGARAYGALLEGEDEDVFGLGLGGQTRYALSQTMSASAGLFYAPDILTFGDSDGVYDAFLRLEFLLRPGLSAFVGYRLLEIDEANNRELDDHAHVGVRWTF